MLVWFSFRIITRVQNTFSFSLFYRLFALGYCYVYTASGCWEISETLEKTWKINHNLEDIFNFIIIQIWTCSIDLNFKKGFYATFILVRLSLKMKYIPTQQFEINPWLRGFKQKRKERAICLSGQLLWTWVKDMSRVFFYSRIHCKTVWETNPTYIYIYIYIIILMSCRRHGYPWPSLATSPYHSSPQGYILCLHIAVVCKFELVVLLLLGHMRGSIGVHPLRARPCLIYIYIYI